MVTLEEQRKKAFTKSTKNCTKSDKFKDWFSPNEEIVGMQTRSMKSKYKEVAVRTKAFAKSAILQMVKEANRIAEGSKFIKLGTSFTFMSDIFVTNIVLELIITCEGQHRIIFLSMSSADPEGVYGLIIK